MLVRESLPYFPCLRMGLGPEHEYCDARITDKAVTRLARSCTRLRYIDLACESLVFAVSSRRGRQKLIELRPIFQAATC